MIKSENDILFNRLKNNVGFHRSKKFKDWFHKEYPEPGTEMHHLFGSYTSKKTSDYCSIPLPYNHVESEAHRNNSDFAIDNLHILLIVLQKYIIYLEDK